MLASPIWPIRSLQEKILNDLFFGMMLASIPAVFVSLARFRSLGIRPLMLLQMLIACAVMLAWYKRESIPYLARVSFLLFAFWLHMVSSISNLGLLAESKSTIILFVLSSFLFLERKWAIVSISLLFGSFMVLAYAATNQWLSFDIHYENYHQSPTSWLNAMFAWIASSLIIAYVGWRLLQQIQQRTQESDELVQQINQIANNVAGVLFKLNAPPDGEWYFSYVSEASLGVLGLSPDDMKHNIDKFSGIIHPNDREKVRLDAEQSAKKFTLWEHEFRIVSPVVGDRWMHCNANPSKGADGSIIFHGYIQDVTEQKRLQSVKEDFISVVSHELRTPLTSIKGALQLVNSGCLTETPQKVDYLLDIAEKNSIRLLFLINDLLDIEKLERESFSLKYEQVDLCSFLDTCLEENESYAAQSNMTFSRTSCKAAKLSIDIQRMKQVMANLLSNACKYSPEGEPIEISAVVETQRVVIAVKDNGPGIPPAFHDKIFDKFTQVDTSSTRSAGGTGLGLSIAKQIVELHSGSIWFETAPNEGSTFFIALPLHPSHFEEEVSL